MRLEIQFMSLLALLASPMLGQEQGQKPGQQPGQTPPAAPTAQQPKETGAKEILLIRAETGAKASVKTADGQAVGSIADYVIERESGRVPYVVLQTTGGKKVAVPYQQFKWDGKSRELRVTSSAADLEKLHEFEMDKLQSLGQPGSTAKPDEGQAKPGEASAPKGDENPKNLLASQIARNQVLAEAKPVGTIETLILNAKEGRTPVVLVTPTEKMDGTLVVPFRALKRDATGKWTMTVSADTLKTAPMIKGSDLDKLNDPAFQQQVQSFYKLPQPL